MRRDTNSEPGGDLSPSWRDHLDVAAARPSAPENDEPAFYVEIGAFQQHEYARNAFVRGTEEEIAVLGELVDLSEGVRVLDVGCADGRHLRRLARNGVRGTGVDVSQELIDAARHAAAADDVEVHFAVGDARRAGVLEDVTRRHAPGGFDVVWSLCQGAMGTSPVTDPAILSGLASAVRPGGRVVVTFFHALFAARHLAPGDAFDPVHGVHHQVSDVHGPDHAVRRFDLWTTAYTVPDAVNACASAGLHVLAVRGVQPGMYGSRHVGEVALDDPEILLVAERRD